MTHKLFDRSDFLAVDNLTYADFDKRSRDILKLVALKISLKYDRECDPTTAVEIEHDGSPDWFYVGFPHEGKTIYYMMCGGAYDDPDEDVFIQVETCDDYYRNM